MTNRECPNCRASFLDYEPYFQHIMLCDGCPSSVGNSTSASPITPRATASAEPSLEAAAAGNGTFPASAPYVFRPTKKPFVADLPNKTGQPRTQSAARPRQSGPVLRPNHPAKGSRPRAGFQPNRVPPPRPNMSIPPPTTMPPQLEPQIRAIVRSELSVMREEITNQVLATIVKSLQPSISEQ